MMAKSLRISALSSDVPVIEAEALSCKRAGRVLFEDLSFALDPGEAMLLLGPNGSGKSSLLRLLAGFIQPHAGKIWMAGKPIQSRHNLSYLGHANPLKPVLTVADNIAFFNSLGGGADSLRSHFGLDVIAQTPARYLSSGQRRRTSLAALLDQNKAVWLLDEPGVGLDHDHRKKLEQAIQMYRKNGGVVIAASHGDVELDNPLILDFPEAPL